MVRQRSSGFRRIEREPLSWERMVTMLANELALAGPERDDMSPMARMVIDGWTGDIDLKRRDGQWWANLIGPHAEYEGWGPSEGFAVLEAARKTILGGNQK